MASSFDEPPASPSPVEETPAGEASLEAAQSDPALAEQAPAQPDQASEQTEPPAPTLELEPLSGGPQRPQPPQFKSRRARRAERRSSGPGAPPDGGGPATNGWAEAPVPAPPVEMYAGAQAPGAPPAAGEPQPLRGDPLPRRRRKSLAEEYEDLLPPPLPEPAGQLALQEAPAARVADEAPAPVDEPEAPTTAFPVLPAMIEEPTVALPVASPGHPVGVWAPEQIASQAPASSFAAGGPEAPPMESPGWATGTAAGSPQGYAPPVGPPYAQPAASPRPGRRTRARRGSAPAAPVAPPAGEPYPAHIADPAGYVEPMAPPSGYPPLPPAYPPATPAVPPTDYLAPAPEGLAPEGLAPPTYLVPEQISPAPPLDESVAAQVIDAVKLYGSGETTVRALDRITVSFAKGHFTAIMGPSGSGKSTLMHCLAGLDRLTAGRVLIGASDLSALSDKDLTKLRRDHVGFIFQTYNLVPTLTALENITLPLDLAGTKPDRAWLDDVIHTLRLQDRLRHKPDELSGGQQQRVAVARALATKPKIIFADEPTGNLDTRSGAEVLGILRDSVKGLGQTVVMVTHDPNAAGYADRAIFLVDGRVVAEMAEPTADRVLDQMKTFGG